MKEVAWIFGGSGTGKETFIKHVVANPTTDVCHRLGWNQKDVTACQDSIDHIAGYEGDPVIAKRAAILQVVPELLETADVVLVKWQLVDSSARIPELLHDAVPDAHHRLIVLQADLDELERRLPHKWWWDEADDPVHYALSERISVEKEVGTLGRVYGFEATYLNSTQPGMYPELEKVDLLQ